MRWFEWMWIWLATAVGGYVAMAGLVTVMQRRLIYQPDPRRSTPTADGFPGVSVWTMATPDGETVVAWYSAASSGYPTLLYFHGNAGWIEWRAERMAELSRRGFGVLMPSYRGYGGSTGSPSEIALISDAKLAYDTLRNYGIEAKDIIVFGESLGTGVAAQLAAAKVCAGLVLDSPYTSMTDLAQRNYPWLPVQYLLWDNFETAQHIKRVTVPVLVLHGDADALVPVAMGIAVHDAAVSPRELKIYAGAPHLGHGPQGSFDDVERWSRNIIRTGATLSDHETQARSDAADLC